MSGTESHLGVSSFRCRKVAWIILLTFCFSFVPSVGLAQQPTATIKTLNGDVLISGQAATAGDVLQAGDSIQTQAGASVTLTLSDDSELQVGENTRLNMAELSQTASGARVSRISLLAGWLRTFLSPGHQKEGSSFTIETPNAQVGVRFSQPDVEVSYDPAKQETVGIAHTVELMAKNLLTNEQVLVPVGSSVLIVGTTIKIVAGILTIAGATEAASTGSVAAATETGTTTGAVGTTTASTASGIGTGTMIAIGAGAAAAIGGVAAVAANSGDSSSNDTGNGIDWDAPFTGTFFTQRTNSDAGGSWIEAFTLNLTQTTATSVSGTLDVTFTGVTGTIGPGGPGPGTTTNCPCSITGTVTGMSVVLTYSLTAPCPVGGPESGTANCTLENDGNLLRWSSNQTPQLDFIRQN